MKRYLLNYLLFLCIGILCTVPAHAESTRIIQLKDGTIIHGRVIGLANGHYTIESPNLGQISILEDKVLSINTINESLMPQPFHKPKKLKAQVNVLQQNLLSDPKVIQEIQEVFQDPALQNILSDQEFIEDIFSYDFKRINHNNRTKELMDNPDVMKLIERLQERLHED